MTDYQQFEAAVVEHAQFWTKGRPVFKTPTQDLFGIYLSNLSPDIRQEHNCRSCKHFFERFGGLAVLDKDANLLSAVWPEKVSKPYQKAATALRIAVEACGVEGVFLSKDNVLGTPTNRYALGQTYHHLWIPNLDMFQSLTQSADQKMAEKLMDFHTMRTAMSEWSKESVKTLVHFLRTQGDVKSIGQAEWLLRLHEQDETFEGVLKMNAFWRVIATAPAGFLHPKAGIVGSVLDDITAGYSEGAIASRFKEKMDPTVYQRPTTVTSGNIAQAEKIVSQLGIEKAFRRRYARLDECEVLWQSGWKSKEQKAATYKGVFSGLKPTAPQSAPSGVNAGNMTWRSFSEKLLPSAIKIEYSIPNYNIPIYTLTAAVDNEAPLIFQWPNHYGWYVWQDGSRAEHIGLKANTWIEVAAVIPKPCHWKGHVGNFPKLALFALKGARELRNAGSAVFPEMLKSELHQIRSTIEAHSSKTNIEYVTPQPHTVSGPGAQPGMQASLQLRVTGPLGVTQVTIDRWE